MLFRFGGEAEPMFGAVAISADGSDFEPGRRFVGVRLSFWPDEELSGAISRGVEFSVWYEEAVGAGVVTSP